MKQCIRCKNIVNDNEQFCPKCGGMQFNFGQNTPQQPRPVQPRPAQPRQSNQFNNQAPINQDYNQQQQYQQNTYNNQQQYQQQQYQQQQYTNQQYQQNTYNNQYNNNTNNNFVQSNNSQYNNSQNQYQQNSKKASKKISKKEQQNREMQMMLAMKAAKEKGEPFNKEQFYMEHGWELPGESTKSNQYINNANSNISSDGSVKDWLITLILLIVPILNIFIAVSNMNNIKNSEYKKNFYKAYLIYYIAALILSIAISFIL